MIKLFLIVSQILLLVLRWLEHKGKVNEAKAAVARDMHKLRVRIGQSADSAVDALDTSPDGVLNDEFNRDTARRGENDKTDSL